MNSEQLQREVEKHPGIMLIIMGDLNVKVGEDNIGWERVMGSKQ